MNILPLGANEKILDSGGVSCAVIAVNRSPQVLHLLSSDWFSREWQPNQHHRWPDQFKEETILMLLVIKRVVSLPKDLRRLLTATLGHLYRMKRLRKGYLKRMR